MNNLKEHTKIKNAIRNGDFRPLISLFRTQDGKPFIAAQGQMEIIEYIITNVVKWVSVNAYTGYGKSDCISIGIILRAILIPGEKIYIVAPTGQKSKIIMRYVGRHLGDHPFFMSQLSHKVRDKHQLLSAELNQSFRTFKNNSSIQILSADIPHQGEAAMGEGGTFVAIDECEPIPIEIVMNKILRMRRTEESMLFLIGNPTQKGYLYRSMTDKALKNKWKHIHIGWRQGVEEGRTTTTYIDEMAEEFGGYDSIGFKIMYESIYPQEYEDTLIPYQKIMDAVNYEPKGGPKLYGMGVDPAHLGADEATIIDGEITSKGEFICHSLKAIAKCTVPEIIGIIRQRYVSHGKKYDFINIDYQGLQGVVDGLRDKYPGMRDKINGIKHGASAPGWNSNGEKYSNLFANTKSRNYWYLRELFMNGLIKIPRDEMLIEQLLGWKYKHLPNGKIFVMDPDGIKSPDRADALVYLCAPINLPETNVYGRGWNEGGELYS